MSFRVAPDAEGGSKFVELAAVGDGEESKGTDEGAARASLGAAGGGPTDSPSKVNTLLLPGEERSDAPAAAGGAAAELDDAAKAAQRMGESFTQTPFGEPISPRTAARRAAEADNGSGSEDSDESKDSQYNNVSLEDIERRLAKSYVYKVDTKQDCEDMRLAIDPRSGFSRNWDNAMVLCLLFTAFVTPYEIAFLGTGTGVLLYVNRLVDFLFVCDMGINFFLAFMDDEEGQWIFENKRIALRYLKGWFVIDLVSILPYDYADEIFGDASNLQDLKPLRLIRLLRLIKLARVLRASRLFKRFELSTDLPYAVQKLMKYAWIVTLVIHWIACLWRLSPEFNEGNNWLVGYDDIGVPDETVEMHFVRSLYMAVSALPMGVLGVVVPVSTEERIITIIAMLVSGSIYGYLIGEVCDTVSNLDPATAEFHETMDHLNAYLEDMNVPREKRLEVREYFHHCRALFRYKFYHHLLEQMSPALRGDVSLHMHQAWIEEIPFFRAEDAEERSLFIASLAMALKPEAYAPKELIIKPGDPTDKMYIVQRGLVARQGKVMGAGRFFGEDVIVHGSRRAYSVRVLTYVDVMALARDDLETVLDGGDFPQTRRLIRMAAIRLALTREICRIAANARMAKMAGRMTGKALTGEQAQRAVEMLEKSKQGAADASDASLAKRFEGMTDEEISRAIEHDDALRRQRRGSVVLPPEGTTVIDPSEHPRNKPKSEPALKGDVHHLMVRLTALEDRVSEFARTMTRCFAEYRIVLQHKAIVGRDDGKRKRRRDRRKDGRRRERSRSGKDRDRDRDRRRRDRKERRARGES